MKIATIRESSTGIVSTSGADLDAAKGAHRGARRAATAWAGIGACTAALLACGPAPSDEVALAAIATLRPTEGSAVHGTIEFHPARSGGLVVKADVAGLPPGPHAYHVHLHGDCTAPDASSAGPHFNFVGSSTNPPEGLDRITGNLGELEPEQDGAASDEHVVELASLWGPASIVGRSVVVHARGNDLDAPPAGDAGERLACGVIGIADADG